MQTLLLAGAILLLSVVNILQHVSIKRLDSRIGELEEVMKDKDKVEINEGHYFEMTDRLHVLLCTFEEHISGHPLTEHDRNIADMVDKVMDAMSDLHQYVGTQEWEEYKK